MTWFFFQILKGVVVVAAVSAYAEVGPGGEVLASMISSTKELMLSVDYADWWNSILLSIGDFSEAALADVSAPEKGDE